MEKHFCISEILYGHKEEIFYSRCFGPVKFLEVRGDGNIIHCTPTSYPSGEVLMWLPDGRYCDAGEIDLYPSKDKSWKDWMEEQKAPKTWNEIVPDKYTPSLYCEIGVLHDREYQNYAFNEFSGISPIEKSALAFFKIYQLLEAGYGGIVTPDDWYDDTLPKWILVEKKKGEFEPECVRKHTYRSHIAFYKHEQAREFLIHPENIELLKIYHNIQEND